MKHKITLKIMCLSTFALASCGVPKQPANCPTVQQPPNTVSALTETVKSESRIGGTIEFFPYQAKASFYEVGYSNVKKGPAESCGSQFRILKNESTFLVRALVSIKCITNLYANGTDPYINISTNTGYLRAPLKINQIELKDSFFRDLEGRNRSALYSIFNIAIAEYHGSSLLNALEKKSDPFLCVSKPNDTQTKGITVVEPSDCLSPAGSVVIEGTVQGTRENMQSLIDLSTASLNSSVTANSAELQKLVDLEEAQVQAWDSQYDFGFRNLVALIASKNCRPENHGDLCSDALFYLKSIKKNIFKNWIALHNVISKLESGNDAASEISSLLTESKTFRSPMNASLLSLISAQKAVYSMVAANKSGINISANFGKVPEFRAASSDEFASMNLNIATDRITWNPTRSFSYFESSGLILDYKGFPFLTAKSENNQSGGLSSTSLPKQGTVKKDGQISGSATNDCK